MNDNEQRPTERRRYIRDHDYYGGTVYLVMPKDQHDDGNDGDFYADEGPLDLVWQAWGGHGTATITLKDPKEMHDLGVALIIAAKAADPEGYYLED